MSAVAYGKPFVIVVTSSLTRICDMVTITYCLQANGPSPDETLVQHAYDAGSPYQLWVYGSDQRIYLASTIASTPLCIDTKGGLLTNGTPLVLSPVKPNKTQQWYLYSSSHPSSYISLVNTPRIVMDAWNDSGRQLAPGRPALICESSNGNANQIWTIWTSSSLPWPRPLTAPGETGAETRAAQEAEAARAAAEAAASSAREALALAEVAKKSAADAEARSAKQAADARAAAEAVKAGVQVVRDAEARAVQAAADARTAAEAVKAGVQAARDAEARAVQEAADARTAAEVAKGEVQAVRDAVAHPIPGAEAAGAQAVVRAAQDTMAAAEAAQGFAAQTQTATIARPDAGYPSWIWIPIGVLSLLSCLLALRVH